MDESKGLMDYPPEIRDAAIEAVPPVYSAHPGEGKATGQPESLEREDGTDGRTRDAQGAGEKGGRKAAREFPKSGSGEGVASVVDSPPGHESPLQVRGEFLGQRQTISLVKENGFSAVRDERDREIVTSALEKIGPQIPEARRQALVDLVARQEIKPPHTFATKAEDFLGRKAESLAKATIPEEKAQDELAGWLGEKLSLMFELGNEQVVTVFGREALDRIRVRTSLVETTNILPSKDEGIAASLVAAEKAFFAIAESEKSRMLTKDEFERGMIGRVFQSEVVESGYREKDIKEAITFDQEAGKYVANGKVVFPEAPVVIETLARLNNIERPDGLILPRVKDAKTGRLVADPNRILGTVENKAYNPWNVEEMLKAMEKNPARTILGGDGGGQHLAVDLAGQLDYVEQLTPDGFPNRKDAIVVVRFPADAQEETLIKMGEQAEKKGIRNLVIQKLPYTRAELDVLIEATLAKVNLDEIIAQVSERKK